uniref:Uncharacterized protein n=1 Tax=Fagus sylvatica TaxID=28930 RepID=A0A2N9GAH3_FAGSY
MTSKLAMLVNTEESMMRFRLLYQIPPSVSLTYCNSDNFPVINRGEILIPIMAIVEGGVREVLAVYQYKCPGAKSNTLCHLVARNVNEKLVNGLPSTNKGFEKDYLRVGGIWFPGSSLCRSEFGQPDQKRLESARKQGDAELIRRVLSANFCVDERGEPRSAPLLLGYEPQVKSFLEGPTVPRSEAFEILPRAPYIAQPAETEKPEDYPDRIPVGQVYAMAPPINPFEPLEEIPITESESRPTPERVPSPEPAKDQRSEEPEHEEELQPRKKKGRNRTPNDPNGGAFLSCLGLGPRPTVRRTSDYNMKKWAGTQPGPAFRHVTKNLIMATQGVMTMEAKFYRLSEKHQKTVAEHEKVMSDTLRATSENLKKLEDEISTKANLMKEAEERARAEETKRSEAEAEVARLQERVRELESECISRLNKAHQEGMREGEQKGMEEGLQKGESTRKRGSHGRSRHPDYKSLTMKEAKAGGVDEEEEEEEEGKEGEGRKEDGGEQEEKEGAEGEGRKEEEAEKERKEGEGRKEEEKEKEEGEAIAEGSQLQADDRIEPTVVVLDVVDLTEQTSTTFEQPPNSIGTLLFPFLYFG